MPRSRVKLQRSSYKPYSELSRKQQWERRKLKQKKDRPASIVLEANAASESLECVYTTTDDNVLESENLTSTEITVDKSVNKPVTATDILTNWALNEVNVPKSSISRLLKDLQSVLPSLPSTHKSLLPTPLLQYHEMGDGKYVHLPNWVQSLHKLLLYLYRDMQGTIKYNLVINIDGLPLFKHSPDFKVYPILVTVYKTKMRPICAGIYSTEKSKNREMPVSENFLKMFLKDLDELRSTPIVKGQLCLQFFGNGIFVCDAPARSSLKLIKSHSGYHSCERCCVTGFYDPHSKHVCFQTSVFQKRTDMDFINQADQEHHKGTSVLAEFGVNMVTGFVLDYMHLACLGVMKRLLSYWKGATRVHQGKMPSLAIVKFNEKIRSIQSYVPKEFNRKLRPLSELSYWKASELRMFMLYVGAVILKDTSILPKQNYKNFLKFLVAMRCLTTSEQNVLMCKNLLSDFCIQACRLYGKGFVSYNVHSIMHLPDDCQFYGSLELVNCFKFESYLGILKSCVRSGYKPLEQVASCAFQLNENILRGTILEERKANELVYKTKDKGVSLDNFGSLEHYRKAKLCNGSEIDSSKMSDCTIRHGETVAKVYDIVKADGEFFFVVKKYCQIQNLFQSPVYSQNFGISKLSNLSCDYSLIKLNNLISKCFLMPFRKKFVAVDIIHCI